MTSIDGLITELTHAQKIVATNGPVSKTLGKVKEALGRFDAIAHLKAGGKVTYPRIKPNYMMLDDETVSVFNKHGVWQYTAHAHTILRDDLKPYEEPVRERGWYWCSFYEGRRPLWWTGKAWFLSDTSTGPYLEKPVSNVNPKRIVEDMT